MNWLKQAFSLEPARVATVAGLVYAAGAMLYRAYDHQGVLQPDVLVAAVTAVWGVWTRAKVTPLADPKDDKGRPLQASQQ